MGQLIIKLVEEYYPSDDEIKRLLVYIAGNGSNKYKEGVIYIGAYGVKRDADKAAEQIIRVQEVLGKNNGRRVYQMVVSFPEEVKELEKVKQSAKIIASEIFRKYQVFYGIHTST